VIEMMDASLVSRRGFVVALAAGTAASWIAAHARELEAVASAAAAAGPKEGYAVLTPEQAALCDAVCSQIIPSDDQFAGAREAKVVRFIDRAAAGVLKDDAKEFLAALDKLALFTAQRPGGGAFEKMSDADQLAALAEFEKTDSESFSTIRGFTMLGYFADPKYGGNDRKLGWKMIGFEDRFFWSPPFGWYDRG
jgi:gluconate 2-dehydrogenase gamma chain